jgi:mono/diheme cytochrome c family protein
MFRSKLARDARDDNHGGGRQRRFSWHHGCWLDGWMVVDTFMKLRTAILIIVVVLLGMGGALAAMVLHGGLSATATPTRLEALLARSARHLAIPENAREQHNPMSATPENVRDGMMHFADHCAICHGNDGSGDSMIGHGLYPKPPNLKMPDTQKLSDGELFWIIQNGVRFTGMPSFAEHGKEDGWKLVLFVRHLPELTPPENAEMERNNPKAPSDRDEEQQENNFLNGSPEKGKTKSPN